MISFVCGVLAAECGLRSSLLLRDAIRRPSRHVCCDGGGGDRHALQMSRRDVSDNGGGHDVGGVTAAMYSKDVKEHAQFLIVCLCFAADRAAVSFAVPFTTPLQAQRRGLDTVAAISCTIAIRPATRSVTLGPGARLGAAPTGPSA